jgi:hypothetical protein
MWTNSEANLGIDRRPALGVSDLEFGKKGITPAQKEADQYGAA